MRHCPSHKRAIIAGLSKLQTSSFVLSVQSRHDEVVYGIAVVSTDSWGRK